jgi:hypothetical protein
LAFIGITWDLDVGEGSVWPTPSDRRRWIDVAFSQIPGTVYLIPFQQLKEVPGVRVSSRWLGPRLLSLERAPEALLRIFDKGIGTERATGTGMRVQQVGDVRGVGLADEASPVGYRLQQRTHADELVVRSGRMNK